MSASLATRVVPLQILTHVAMVVAPLRCNVRPSVGDCRSMFAVCLQYSPVDPGTRAREEEETIESRLEGLRPRTICGPASFRSPYAEILLTDHPHYGISSRYGRDESGELLSDTSTRKRRLMVVKGRTPVNSCEAHRRSSQADSSSATWVPSPFQIKYPSGCSRCDLGR